jgi:dTMP kinase
MKKNRGKFITIEGSEGVGKSTNIKFIQQYLSKQGIPLVLTREPGGTPLAESLRNLLLQHWQEKVDEQAELLMLFAARAQHVSTVIQPALERGEWVLCDRFTDSTYAYQGGGRGLDLKLIEQLESLVLQGFQPDTTIYLDIDVKQGLQRASTRGELDRFETEEIDFFERVRKAYLKRVESTPSRYALIDAGESLDKVQQSIQSFLEHLIK